MRGKHQRQVVRRQESEQAAASAHLVAELEALTQELAGLADEDAALRNRLRDALATLRDRSALAEGVVMEAVAIEAEAAALERRVHALSASLRRWIVDMWDRDMTRRGMRLIPRQALPLMYWALSRTGGAANDAYKRHRAFIDWVDEQRGHEAWGSGDAVPAPSFMWRS